MRRILRFIFLLALFAGSIYLFFDQRKKLGSPGAKARNPKPKSYSIEELQNRRNHMIDNIQDGM